jgi:sporulation protein YlmC with PRC-barrel domain
MSHTVSFAVPKRELGRADVKFDINTENEKIGTLAVSKGSVVWFPKDHSYGYKVGWADVDRIFTEQGSKSEKR